MEPGFAGQSVVDGSDQNLSAKRQQQLEDTVAQIIKVPAGLAEEAMERAVVFELGELRGLNDTGEGTAARAEDPSAGHGPEGLEGRLSEAGLKSEQELGKGTHQEIGHQASLSFISNK